MKMISFLIGTVATFLLGAGCIPSAVPSPSPSSISSPYEAERQALDHYRKTPDRLVWKADASAKDAVISQLTAGNKIREVAAPRKAAVPSDIYPPQLVKFFELGDIQFAIVQVLSGVGLGRWDQQTTLNSGIWYIDKDDAMWKPLIVLVQSESYRPHNNIFDFWNEGNQVYILMADSYGGGSGDGTAKILSSTELDNDWSINRCLYLSGGFYDFQKRLGITSERQALPRWLISPLNQGATFEYIFNHSTGKFEITQFDEYSQKKVAVAGEECQNISSH